MGRALNSVAGGLSMHWCGWRVGSANPFPVRCILADYVCTRRKLTGNRNRQLLVLDPKHALRHLTKNDGLQNHSDTR
jgi:hypothetical protein